VSPRFSASKEKLEEKKKRRKKKGAECVVGYLVYATSLA